MNEEICIETNGNEMEDRHEVKDFLNSFLRL